MNMVTIAVLVVLAIVVVFAAIGSYKNFQSEKCCCEDKNCTGGATRHCNIRKDGPEQ